MAEQMTFDLAVRPSLGRGDFFVSDANAMALVRLDAVEGWPLNKLVLVGPEGAGKTHLAHVWAKDVGAKIVQAEELADLDIGATDTAVALDDADRLAEADEPLLFHLHNHLAAEGLPLLLTAREAPSRWSIALPDLKSRMEGTDVVRIEAPDDDLLTAVLVKHFADRQISVTPATIAWMVRHLDRTFAAAKDAVARIDAAALSKGRAITRDLAQEVLDNGQATGP